MAFRQISVGFWFDTKAEGFTPEEKFIFLYFLTNPHTNLSGCYEISARQIENESGLGAGTIERLIGRLEAHNVVRYSKQTRELLILNWSRYNWTASGKLNKPILAEIRRIKCQEFRAYLAALYNARESVTERYEPGEEAPEVPPVRGTEQRTQRGDESQNADRAKKHQAENRQKFGEHGWVKLTQEERSRLLADFGEAELARCISYIDELAQSTGNKNGWKDWNLVIRRCAREGWGRARAPTHTTSGGTQRTLDSYRALDSLFADEEEHGGGP